jgi:hypothetical protein
MIKPDEPKNWSTSPADIAGDGLTATADRIPASGLSDRSVAAEMRMLFLKQLV